MGLQTENLRNAFESDGFAIRVPVCDEELLEKARAGMEKVLKEQYDRGKEPAWGEFSPADVGERLVKVNDAHLADSGLFALVSDPRLGEAAAAVTGAKMVQVWHTQLIHKPNKVAEKGNIGWHQDEMYWPQWEGEVFTAWVALNDVPPERGPMHFIRGSHRWGLIEEASNFNSYDIDSQKDGIPIPPGEKWDEVTAEYAAGEASFHHRRTIHGSGPNLSDTARLGIAIHLRTEKGTPVPDSPHKPNLDDLEQCPIIYDAGN